MKTRKGGSPVRTVLLALIVIAAAVASIAMIQHKKTADEEAQIKQDDQPLDVTPIMIKGNITKASWREPGQMPEQKDSVSPDWEASKPFNGGNAKKERFDTSLETTMKALDGLSVFVSTSADDEEDKKEEKK